MKKNNSGFSLVELIIVIAIMAVLIGVLAPQFIKYVESSRESTDLQNIAEVKTTVETYIADSEDTGATAITVTLSKTQKAAMTIKVGSTDLDLSEYGVDASKITTKAKDWSADIQWEYKDYKWECKSTSAKGSAYNYDGSKVTTGGEG